MELNAYVQYTPQLPADNLGKRALDSGDCLVAHGRFAHARMALLKALHYLPNSFHAHVNIANVYGALGDNDHALYHLRRALQIEPEAQAALPNSQVLLECSDLDRMANDGHLDLPTPPNFNPPLVTMSLLGINGRFGNQIYQYGFLKCYAKAHGFQVETPEWIGRQLFNANDPMLSTVLPFIFEAENQYWPPIQTPSGVPAKNVDIQGYFQYHSSAYAPFRDYFRSLFVPVEPVREVTDGVVRELRKNGNTLVAVHIRRGDLDGDSYHCNPVEIYIKWLEEIWPTLDKPVLIVASDEPDKILPNFRRFNLFAVPQPSLPIKGIEFYNDFYVLTQADVLAVSNSSFSFGASLLNNVGKAFFRPKIDQSGLRSFDPWSEKL